ncbi:hypothetical protein ASD14_13735 [Lysobacter sp. Root494]|nr:hypothetical protein ASD14_13735 [Lysobacter sp. Root494]
MGTQPPPETERKSGMTSEAGLVFASGVGHGPGAARAGAASRMAETAKMPRHARKAGTRVDVMVNPLYGAPLCAGPIKLGAHSMPVITHLG